MKFFILQNYRKVNRSYRGRAAPILVHSNQGAGRTGTYCVIDMLCARIQRGVKGLNMKSFILLNI